MLYLNYCGDFLSNSMLIDLQHMNKNQFLMTDLQKVGLRI